MRNLLATLIGIGKLEKSSSIPEKVYDFTLVDCNATTIARDFVILLLLEELADLDSDNSEEAADRAFEINSCLFYTYMAPIMPDSEYDVLEEKLEQALDVLHSHHGLPKFLTMPEGIYSQLINVLEDWLDKVEDEFSASRVRPHVVHSRQASDASFARDFPGPYRSCGVPELEKQELFYRATGVLTRSLDPSNMDPDLARAYESFDSADPQSLDRTFLREIDKTWRTNPTLFDLY